MRTLHTDSEQMEDFRVGDAVVTERGRACRVRSVRKTRDGTLLVTIRIAHGDDRVYSSLPSRHAGYPLSALKRLHTDY